jgi:hypothetical protein
MDLNELLHAHQTEVIRASAAGDQCARDNHFAKVAEYAERVRQLREMRNAPVTSPSISRPAAIPDPGTIIYGTYAGSAEQLSPAKAIDGWEDEGGALDPPQFAALPEGMTSKTVRQYHVGPYVYQDIDLAMAEHLRQLSAD